MKQINRFLQISTLLVAGMQFGGVQQANAGVAVVVPPSIGVAAIDEAQVANLFLGKMSSLPDGTKLEPIDRQEGEEPRNQFYMKVVKKNASQLNAYWSRLIFTGKGQPPKAVLDDEVVEAIGAAPGKIGYGSDAAVGDSVKVILKIP